ncbi:MAG TPA: transcriptional repressor LexA [Armatimonadota bacterium]
MDNTLTDRQRRILEIIVEETEREGRPPTVREIAAAAGIKSPKGVSDHLTALERKGLLERTGSHRGLRVTQGPVKAPSKTLPLVGTIAAGVPITAEENVADYVAVPEWVAGSTEQGFLLLVKGDSMVGDLIGDGDLAVIRPQADAQSGDLVAVLVDDEATLKRLYRQGGTVELHASNPAYEPIPLRGRDARILGKLVGILRRY